MNLRLVLEKARAFEAEAHRVLGVHEAAPSRTILLEESYKTLTKLSIRQDELFRQSLRCIEQELFRSAHVMAWAGFMDFLEEKICSDGLVKLRTARPKWMVSSIDELREAVVEYQLIEVVRELGLCGKAEMKAFHGHLSKQNECAHPSGYYPGLNETLGFVAELLNRIAQMQPRHL